MKKINRLTKAQVLKLVPERIVEECGVKPSFDYGLYDGSKLIIVAEMFQSVSGSAGIKRLAWIKDNVEDFWQEVSKTIPVSIEVHVDKEWFYDLHGKEYRRMLNKLNFLGVKIVPRFEK